MLNLDNPAWLGEDADWNALLAQDANGKFLDTVVTQLRQAAGRVKRRLDQGVTSDEFTRLSGFLQGLEAAEKGLAGAWAKRHPSQGRG